MKRFSGAINKTTSNKVEKQIKKLIKEKLSILIDGQEPILSFNLNENNFTSDILQLIEEKKEEQKNETLSQLRLLPYNDQTLLEQIYETAKWEMGEDVLPSPEDIFSSEDYEVIENGIELRSLENIPEDFADYISSEDAKYFFDDQRGTVVIFFDGNFWSIDFDIYGDAYMYSNKEDYIKENSEFIADFLSACINLLGKDHIKFDKMLLDI